MWIFMSLNEDNCPSSVDRVTTTRTKAVLTILLPSAAVNAFVRREGILCVKHKFNFVRRFRRVAQNDD